MKEARQQLDRLDRILKVRQMAVDEAEVRVRASEGQIQLLLERLQDEEGKIRHTMENFSRPDRMTGLGLQGTERAIEMGQIRSRKIQQDVEKIEAKREENLALWREARREHKTVEKLRERQLQRISREEAVSAQKTVDELSVMRHLRKIRTEEN